MKKSMRRVAFYLFYLVFAMAVTTGVVKALSGYCYIMDNMHKVYVKCNCNCRKYPLDSQMRCTNCGHYVDV